MAPSPPQAGSAVLALYTREEVAQHKKPDDCWIILRGEVYDVTRWLKRHPGGAKLLEHYAGEDATLAWTSFHNNKTYVRKFLHEFHIGHIVPEEREPSEIDADFLKLRNKVETMGLFKVKAWYFALLLFHIVLLDLAALTTLWYFGNGWLSWLAAALMVTTAQAQAGWLQHDFGHHTVFNSTALNHFCHDITIGLMKGVSSFWWNYRHFQHHAKPNVFLKDPDITIPYALLLGNVIPEKWGKKHWGKLPYHLQQHYFFFIFPPLLLPVYFHTEVIYYVLRKRMWKDLFWMLAFYVTFHYLFASFLGGFWCNFRFYFFVRFLESHWFVWATQISHLPMHIDTDKKKDWVSMQLEGTCNVEQGFFNDWFLGHLNFQIEHHLFPTMPRHNFVRVRPYVREFCKKYGLEYELKTLWTAFGDVVRSLKVSGEIWLEAWHLHDPKAK